MKILSAEDSSAVPHAALFFVSSNSVLVSDDNGVVRIEDELPAQKIILSHVGFIKAYIDFNPNSVPQRIYIEPKTLVISEVIVKPQNIAEVLSVAVSKLKEHLDNGIMATANLNQWSGSQSGQSLYQANGTLMQGSLDDKYNYDDRWPVYPFGFIAKEHRYFTNTKSPRVPSLTRRWLEGFFLDNALFIYFKTIKNFNDKRFSFSDYQEISSHNDEIVFELKNELNEIITGLESFELRLNLADSTMDGFEVKVNYNGNHELHVKNISFNNRTHLSSIQYKFNDQEVKVLLDLEIEKLLLSGWSLSKDYNKKKKEISAIYGSLNSGIRYPTYLPLSDQTSFPWESWMKRNAVKKPESETWLLDFHDIVPRYFKGLSEDPRSAQWTNSRNIWLIKFGEYFKVFKEGKTN